MTQNEISQRIEEVKFALSITEQGTLEWNTLLIELQTLTFCEEVCERKDKEIKEQKEVKGKC